jgi:tape measure domain-containing protein
MATERIQIIVSERGSRTVRRDIESIGTGALSAERALTLLKRTLGTLGVGLAIRELVELSDTYTNIQNRLKLVTTSTQNLATVTAELFRISNETRSSFEGTAQVYARVALSAKDLGRSQKEILQFTESLNKAVILSGASAREAEGALIQLAQGLASNTLQGDELRSVLEQLPLVADVIAEHMGVTRGELRALAKDGKVTAQVVLDAFKEARVELDEKFARTIPTIGQAVQVLKNKFLDLWGTFMTGSGAQSLIATGLLSIADNLGTITRVVAALAIIYAVNWIKNAIVAGTTALMAHISQLIALEIALGATSRTAAVAGVAMKGLQFLWASLPGIILAAAVALVVFSDRLALTQGSATTLQDFFVATFNVITGKVTDAKKEVDDLNKKLDETKAKTQETSGPTFLVDFKRELEGAARAIDDVVTETGQAVGVIAALWNNLGDAIAEAWIDAVNGVIRGINGLSQSIIKFINMTLGLFTGLAGGIIAAFQAVPQALLAIFQRGFNKLASVSEGFLNTLIGGLNQLPFLEVATVKLGRFAEQDMPDIGAEAAKGFRQGFEAGQIFDVNALNIAELENQYAGAGARLGKAIDQAMEFQFTGTQQKLKEIFAEADRVAAARQVDDQLNPAGDPRVTGEDPDEKKAKAKKKLKDAEEEARKALAQFLLELDREIVLLGMSERAAERQAAIWQLEDQMKRRLTASEHALVEARLESWQAAKDNKVIKDMLADLEMENQLLKKVGTERAVLAGILQLEYELKRKLEPLERQRVETMLRENEALRTQNQLLEETVGKRQEFMDKLAAAQALQADPSSGFSATDAFSSLAGGGELGQFFEGTQAQLDAQLAQYQTYYDQIKMMRDARLVDEQSASQALARVEISMLEARLQGTRDFFGTLAQLSSSGNKKLAAIGRAAAATQAIIDGYVAVQKALASGPPPWNIIQAVAIGALTAANVAKILSTPAPQFMTGGSFKVAGNGGPDSQMVSFRATPGEQVDVRTPTQVRKGTGSFGQGEGGSGGGLQARIINVLDPGIVGDYFATPEGEELLVNVMSRNRDVTHSFGQVG